MTRRLLTAKNVDPAGPHRTDCAHRPRRSPPAAPHPSLSTPEVSPVTDETLTTTHPPSDDARRRDRRARPSRRPAAADLDVRRHPQRDDHGRRAPPPDDRPGHPGEHRPVGDHGVHADDGDRHPGDRLRDPAVHHARRVPRGDDPVQPGHRDLRAGARVRRAHRRPRGAGVRHRDHAPAAHDHRHDRDPAGEPRPHDGQHLHRHLGRPGDRPDHLGARAQRARLALAVRAGPADRDRRPGARRGPAAEPDRDPHAPASTSAR